MLPTPCPKPSRRRRVRPWRNVTAVLARVKRGHVPTAKSADTGIAGASPELLHTLREHKALLKAPAGSRRETAAAVTSAARRILTPVEADLPARQCELLMLIAQRTAPLQAALEAMAASLPPMSLADLLQVSEKAFTRFARMFIDRDKQWHDPSRPVNIVEREWHDLNGRIADVTAAVCRAVNACSVRLDPRRRLRDGTAPGDAAVRTRRRGRGPGPARALEPGGAAARATVEAQRLAAAEAANARAMPMAA